MTDYPLHWRGGTTSKRSISGKGTLLRRKPSRCSAVPAGRRLMQETEKCATWVVYQVTIHGKPSGTNAVCEQGEWDAMVRARPGYHTLVQAGSTSEGAAERLARGVPGAGTGKPPELGPPGQ